MCFTKNKYIIKQTKVPKKSEKIKTFESQEKFQTHTRVRKFAICYLLLAICYFFSNVTQTPQMFCAISDFCFFTKRSAVIR